ncbi:MAG: diguanylate cyclase [Rhodocyclaceae bacterium]|nr:diguanylate cyclase [Rhodocyclaceae bacterium]MDZ4216003.1 diguanylate cyclase [Rhodocyclaceae bacterium]
MFQNIVENASDGILVVDLDGYVALSNPAVASLFQIPQEQLQGELFGFPISSGERTEIQVLRKDGSLLVTEMRVSDAYWEGELVFIALLRDISERKQMELALRQTQEELAALYHCAPLGIVALRADWHVKLCNPAAESILGWKADQITGSIFSDFVRPLQPDSFPAEDIVQRGATLMGKEVRHYRQDGTPVDVSISLAPVRDASGRADGIICVIEDISRRMRDMAQLRLSGKIFENTQEGILVTDAQGAILAVNQAFVVVTGYSEQEAIGCKPSMLKSGRHDLAFYADMWHTLRKNRQWSGEIWNRRKSGEVFPEWLNISAIDDDEGNILNYVAIFSDITKIKQNEERLRHLAHFDALTSLPNRFLFQNHVELALAQAVRNNRQFAIMFLDLDHFKAVNDSLGHRAGDLVLTGVAERLSACLRAGDTLSRFGGDEFNALLPDLDNKAAAVSVAKKFVEVLSHPFQIEGKEFHITTSIGIAIYPQDGLNLDQLTRAADAAMYQAKAQGRNAYQFYLADTASPTEK